MPIAPDKEGLSPVAAQCDSTLGAVVASAGMTERVRVLGSGLCIVSSISSNSHAVSPRALFCCVRGMRHDGHTYAAEAVARGASALLVDHPLDLPVPQVVVGNVRDAVGPLSSAVYGHPSHRMRLVGVTGTNGKTTTVALIASILRAIGRPTETIGTLTGAMTTPEAPDLQRRLAEFADRGITDVVMEVSSHALAQHRVDGTRFAVAVFTNLTQDHLDLHGTMDAYFEAKARLFDQRLASSAVVNNDDVWGRELVRRAAVPITGYSLSDASNIEVLPDRIRMRWRSVNLDVPIGGAFNVSNVLAAACTAHLLGVSEQDIAGALSGAEPVPGRFESVNEGQAFHVVVDYAHTPDGLRAVLSAARSAAAAGRLIVVFGCGGDRDREKRPQMGAVAAAGADLVIITSDNPRGEDPRAIIEDILDGLAAEQLEQVLVEQDRAFAIETALRIARPGDVVIVAGKGHETTQTIGDQVIEFDDRAVVRKVLGRVR